ncbi:unnamed protein product, partial [Tetraodon nigroviridis]
DLQLAAELGKSLLERNQELEQEPAAGVLLQPGAAAGDRAPGPAGGAPPPGERPARQGLRAAGRVGPGAGAEEPAAGSGQADGPAEAPEPDGDGGAAAGAGGGAAAAAGGAQADSCRPGGGAAGGPRRPERVLPAGAAEPPQVRRTSVLAQTWAVSMVTS